MGEATGDVSESLLEGLTEAQRHAVLHTEGPLLILAAAGSGKTRVITRRIAHLIHRGIPPQSILALTFTNKAAAEMRERALALLGGAEDGRARGLLVTTFHSLCARLLREHAAAAEVPPGFTIYDTDDQAAVCKRAVEACGLSTTNFPPRGVLAAISRAKNQLLDAEAYARAAREWNTRNIAAVYAKYARLMRDAGAVDFDDLLLLTARLLRENAEVREACRSRWRYLLIDEYQDTNRAQFAIASAIAGVKDANICVVGDPDQSIYGWRGADISNILEFEEHYPGAAVIALGENFRSTAPILAAADALIRHNRRRRHKPLFTSRAGGDAPRVALCRDEADEAATVVNFLRSRHGAGVPWNDMAVFYRTNALSRVVEDACRAAAIPYVIARGTAFYGREEVRHALAYLRILANPADDVSLARVINVPARGIGGTTIEALEKFAAGAGVPLLEAAARGADIPGLPASGARSLAQFVSMVRGWERLAAVEEEGGLTALVDRVVRESGLREMYERQAKAGGLDSDAQRLDNLDELVSSAHEFELEHDAATGTAPRGVPTTLSRLRAYLEFVALVSDADAIDPAQGAVTLMTFHAAKGLEFDSVAMVGLEEGIIPHARAADESDVEEERRLCFVGITRAKRRLLMSAAMYRTHRGQAVRTVPSRFLREIPASCLAIDDRTRAARDDAAETAGVARGTADGGARHGTGPPYRAGMRVRHPQFGVGEIVSVTPGHTPRATVKFRDAGTKTLVLEYARLTVIA